MTPEVLPDDVKVVVVPTPRCGQLRVYVQGNVADHHGKTIFLTCHDIGANPTSWFPFTAKQPTMDAVRAKSVFVHICIPGQEENAPTFPENYTFPSLDDISNDFQVVLDQLKVKSVIAIGDGAGANIVARFALSHPNSVLGLVLIHCTSTAAGMLEHISSKFLNWKMEKGGLSQMAIDYLVYHRFGLNATVKDAEVEAYLSGLEKKMNAGNLHHFIDAFISRTEIQSRLADAKRLDSLLVVGAKASHLDWVYAMHQAMNKNGTTLLIVDNVADVIAESPEKLARALILFCKGCGALSGVAIPGMERQRTLSASMEEADRPHRLDSPHK